MKINKRPKQFYRDSQNEKKTSFSHTYLSSTSYVHSRQRGQKILFRLHQNLNISLIRSNRWRHCRTFRLVQCLIYNRSELDLNFTGDRVHPRECMFTPMFVKSAFLLVVDWFTEVVFVNAILKVFASMRTARFLSVFCCRYGLQFKKEDFHFANWVNQLTFVFKNVHKTRRQLRKTLTWTAFNIKFCNSNVSTRSEFQIRLLSLTLRSFSCE